MKLLNYVNDFVPGTYLVIAAINTIINQIKQLIMIQLNVKLYNLQINQ